LAVAENLYLVLVHISVVGSLVWMACCFYWNAIKRFYESKL